MGVLHFPELFSVIFFISLFQSVYPRIILPELEMTFERISLNEIAADAYVRWPGVTLQAMCGLRCRRDVTCVAFAFHPIRNECHLYDRNINQSKNVIVDLNMRSFAMRSESVNLAANKPTYSSSVKSGRTSSQVVDGDTRPQDFGSSFQCFQTTEEDLYPWLIIDLEEEYFVRSIDVYNAADYPERLHDVNYELYQENPSLNPSAVPNCCASVRHFTFGRNIIRCNPGVSGRFLKISIEKSQFLTLCEVEVYGKKVNACCSAACTHSEYTCYKLPGGENVALNKPTQESSTLPFHRPSNGNNGRFPTLYNTCTHTNHGDMMPYWQVDLQTQYNITSVTIANRVDDKQNVGHRLSDVTISTYTEDPLNGGTPTVCRFLPGEFGCIIRTFECDQVTVGRWLRISKPTEYLTLCEIQVTGKEI